MPNRSFSVWFMGLAAVSAVLLMHSMVAAVAAVGLADLDYLLQKAAFGRSKGSHRRTNGNRTDFSDCSVHKFLSSNAILLGSLVHQYL